MHTCEIPEIPYTNVSQSTIGVSRVVMRWYDLFQLTVYSEKTSDLCCQPLAEIREAPDLINTSRTGH